MIVLCVVVIVWLMIVTFAVLLCAAAAKRLPEPPSSASNATPSDEWTMEWMTRMQSSPLWTSDPAANEDFWEPDAPDSEEGKFMRDLESLKKRLRGDGDGV